MPDSPEVQAPAEILDAETKQMLDELEKEGHQVVRTDKPAPKEEAPKEEPKEPAAKDEPQEPTKETKKEPEEIPLWKVRIAEKRHEQELEKVRKETEDRLRSEFDQKLQELKDQKKQDASPAEIAQTTDELEALAQELNADPAALKKLADAFGKKYALPKEVQDLIKEAPKLREVQQKYEEAQAEAQYNDEFEKEVRPLVEQEYPGVSSEVLSDIRNRVKAAIMGDKRLITAPLSMVYKGTDDFRGLVKPQKPSGEPGRGGTTRSQPTIDLDNVSEEDVRKMDDETFEKYSLYQERKEGKLRR